MKKQELMKRYQDLMEAGKEIYFIMLYIHMPTGEQECRGEDRLYRQNLQ